MTAVLIEIEQRMTELFTRLANGLDVSPGARMRLEGMLEATVLMGVAGEEALTRVIGQCYFRAFAVTLEDQWGKDWQQFFPFPQIPAMMVRAPVVPTTTD